MSLEFYPVISSGIQQLSFILPLLQTAACEQYLGSALTKGYLFVAVAPLSIYGTAGIIQAGFLLLISHGVFKDDILRFLRKMTPEGWSLTGEVSSLTTVSPGTETYRAESVFEELFNTMDVKDVNSVHFVPTGREWHLWMFLSSILAIAFSGTPYIPLIIEQEDFGDPWVALSLPLARAIGSLAITVASQFVLRTRVMNLIKRRFILIAAQKYVTDHQLHLEEPISLRWDSKGMLLARVVSQSVDQGDEENGTTDLESRHLASANATPYGEFEWTGAVWARVVGTTTPDERAHLFQYIGRLCKEHSPRHNHIHSALQLLVLLLGLVVMIYGYFGCFTLVQAASQSSISPLIWLIAELALTTCRSWIWVVDPKFDENSLIKMSFEQDIPPPRLTSGTPAPRLGELEHGAEFPITDNPDLGRALPYLTPRLTCPGVSLHLHYAVLPDRESRKKILFIIISTRRSPDPVIFVWNRFPASGPTFYAATWKKPSVRINDNKAMSEPPPSIVPREHRNKFMEELKDFYISIIIPRSKVQMKFKLSWGIKVLDFEIPLRNGERIMDPTPPDLTAEDLLELLPEAHVVQPTEDEGDAGDEGEAGDEGDVGGEGDVGDEGDAEDEGDDVEVEPLEGI